MTEPASPFVDYRIAWKARSVRPGAFRGTHSGPGERYRTSVPLHAHADPRRLDIKATLRDPLGGIWVRDFEQLSAIDVVVLVDASASMAYVGRHDKFAQAGRVAAALARSAWRYGDTFGLAGAAETVVAGLSLPPRRHRGAAEWVEQQFALHRPSGAGAHGLLDAARLLPARRSLVFVVSDFHWPPGAVETLLRRLARHEVVPVVLRDPAEAQAMPRRGIAVLRDLETGQRRFVWLRRGLLERLEARRRHRDDALRAACAQYGCAPCFVSDRFEPIVLTRHFLETVA